MQSNSHPLSPRPSPPSSPLSLSSPLFPSFPPPAPTAASQHASHTSTGTSATSIVRGFSTDKISTSTRSGTQDAPTPTPNSIQKTSPITRSARLPRKKGATFQYGGSSGEDDESSLESRYMSSGRQSFAKSSLADALRSRGSSRKVTSFNEEVATRTIQDRPYESEDVFEDTDEEDEEADRSGSAIEDDDVGEDWEDTDEPSSPLTINEPTFHRVDDTKLNLVSRRSLLTSLMHEKDRAAALQNAASRSSAIRRSRTTSPNGPLGSSPKNQPQPLTQTLAQELAPASRARPIIITTSNIHPPLLSPRTTRKNMFLTEFTESLRNHLLCDRQVNRSTTKAALKRRHSTQDITKLKNFPGETQPAPFIQPSREPQNATNSNFYFHLGLQEYHQKGW